MNIKLYKYTSHNSNYKYNIIKNSELWFSNVKSFNDPLDSQLDYRQCYTKNEIKKYWKYFLKKKPNHPQSLKQILKKYGDIFNFLSQQKRVFEAFRLQMGVLCMSSNPENILMWSHYANNHKGIVYEFDYNLFSNFSTNSFKGNPYKIDYPNNKSYELLSYVKTNKKRDTQFIKELTTKAIDWKYEEEYRFIDLANNGNKLFNHKSLTSIIFGVRTDECEIIKVKKLCLKNGFNHIKFKKAQFIQGKFEIQIVEI